MAIEHIFTIFNVVRIFVVITIAFFVALVISPLWLKILYKYKLGKQLRSADKAPIFNQLHKKKEGTPTMGGVLVWGTVVVVTLFFWLLSHFIDGFWSKVNFFTRSDTWLPLGMLVVAGLLGMADDLAGILRVGPNGGGLRMTHRILLYIVIAAIGAWWFYFKLGKNEINIPFFGDVGIGWLYMLFFMFIIVATSFSANETDGLDGLAGGVFLTMFAAYGVIAFDQGRMDLTVFIGAIIGALCAFLWHNVYPAKFFMGDTGSMSLGVMLGMIAMLTNTPFLLLPIGIIFLFESSSVIVQMISKKLRNGKKVFLSSPIHHHFEAKGWHETSVTMRFWMISAIGAIIGIIIFLVDSKIPPLMK
ncbi:MAG: hypothetical protein CEN90_12 [Parcubacteria group bacterium Licking1014_17]|nr:MAG: hypothetical protein CEN90_12 [Parcubacteria group bacterium Licking1014_17]